MPTSKRNKLFETLKQYFDDEEAGELADLIQTEAPAAREATVASIRGCGATGVANHFFVEVGSVTVYSTARADEAQAAANAVTDALSD